MRYKNIQDCLTEMWAVYQHSQEHAVRSQQFIRCLHDYFLDEIEKAVDSSKVDILRFDQIERSRDQGASPKERPDPTKFLVMPEARVFGSHKNKDVDIVLSQYTNGPLLTIGIRSEMSSIGKNILNYYEQIIGECISIHDRFPMSVAGYVYLLPDKDYKKDKNGSFKRTSVDLDRAEEMFSLITKRPDWRGPHDLFEHFAFIKVDFDANPAPRILPNKNPDLNYERFIDKMLATYNERNYFNRLSVSSD